MSPNCTLVPRMCDTLAGRKRFGCVQLEELHNLLFMSGIHSGLLTIVDGDLQWADDINCTMQCSKCNQQFQLVCNTYHGRGGRFGPIQSTT